jgi:uncharacterized protein (TIGR03435 family)
MPVKSGPPNCLCLPLLAAIALTGVFCTPAAAQQERPKFDVASIKPVKPGAASWNLNLGHGRTIAESIPLRMLIAMAWDLRLFQIEGGPGWVDGAAYDISAKSETDASDEQTALMLQSLLEDRFQLKVHHETKQHELYSLVLAKGGSKLKVSAPATNGGCHWSPNQIDCSATEMSQFASGLSGLLELPVVDKTGLREKFDLKLQWTPSALNGTDDAGASIFTAIQEQLGLKLESAKGPVEMLVIERIERPAEN